MAITQEEHESQCHELEPAWIQMIHVAIHLDAADC